MMARIGIVLFTMILMAASSLGQRSLGGTEWKLVSVSGATVGQINAFIAFDKPARKFSGTTGCNVMNGTVRVRGKQIDLSTIITTKRACTSTSARVEGSLLSVLDRADRYEISRGQLRLYFRDQQVAEFVRRPGSKADNDDEPQYPVDRLDLEDRKWVLESIAGDSVPKVERSAFINFDAVKGTAGGDTSCNAFGGSYKSKGNSIRITDVISTMRACIEDERMDIERSFLDGLRETDRYEIAADRLRLFKGDRLLLAFSGVKK
jgi:heat shock protein HslJ